MHPGPDSVPRARSCVPVAPLVPPSRGRVVDPGGVCSGETGHPQLVSLIHVSIGNGVLDIRVASPFGLDCRGRYRYRLIPLRVVCPARPAPDVLPYPGNPVPQTNDAPWCLTAIVHDRSRVRCERNVSCSHVAPYLGRFQVAHGVEFLVIAEQGHDVIGIVRLGEKLQWVPEASLLLAVDVDARVVDALGFRRWDDEK